MENLFTKEDIHEILIHAKHLYQNESHEYLGMCSALKDAIIEKQPIKFYILNNESYEITYYSVIEKIIPEFNKSSLSKLNPKNKAYWWDTDNREIRLKAFDLLLDLYKD